MYNDQKILFLFVSIIKSFERCLEIGVGGNNYPHIERNHSIPIQGEIECNNRLIRFHFHGRGCSLTLDDFDVEYDVANGVNPILISPWKFSKFYNQQITNQVSVDYVYEVLKNLEKRGMLISEDTNNQMTFSVNEAMLQGQ